MRPQFRFALGLFVVALAGSVGSSLVASPVPFSSWYTTWQGVYSGSETGDNVVSGSGSSCQLCHQNTGGGLPFNGYGQAINDFFDANPGVTQEDAIRAVEAFNSDNDAGGSTNLEEILSNTQPGFTNNPGAILGAMDPVGEFYCYGVGCACFDDDEGGCQNSTGEGGQLVAFGSDSVASDDLTFRMTRLPANQTAILFMGPDTNNLPFGDGLRCVTGQIVRVQLPNNSGSGGETTFGPGIVAFSNSGTFGGQIAAGQTWHFQGWYQDPSSTCSTPFNTTNAYSVTFQP